MHRPEIRLLINQIHKQHVDSCETRLEVYKEESCMSSVLSLELTRDAVKVLSRETNWHEFQL